MQVPILRHPRPHPVVPTLCQDPYPNSLVTSQPGLQGHWPPVTAPVTVHSSLSSPRANQHMVPISFPESGHRETFWAPPEHPGAEHHPPAHPTHQRAAGLLSTRDALGLHCLGETNGQGATENQQSHCPRVEHPRDCSGCVHQPPGVSNHAQGQYIGVHFLSTPRISPSCFPSLPQPPEPLSPPLPSGTAAFHS